MVDIGNRLTIQWKDAVNFVLGLWLIVSPWALGFVADQTPTWNAWVVGVVIAVAALAALIAFNKWEEWVEAVLGAWLIVSPYLLGFSAQMNGTWNQVIVGIIVGGLAIWSALVTPETTGRAMR
jgi:SPW repeat